jgi:serine/threonine protein phosphatase PrpC
MRRKNIWDSGTTSVSCLYHTISPEKRILYCANAGDSRAVLWYDMNFYLQVSKQIV